MKYLISILGFEQLVSMRGKHHLDRLAAHPDDVQSSSQLRHVLSLVHYPAVSSEHGDGVVIKCGAGKGDANVIRPFSAWHGTISSLIVHHSFPQSNRVTINI